MSARVLIVDDDAAVLRSLATSMTRSGYLTTSAGSIADALAIAGNPDVALVDLHLGSESGLEIVRELRARHGRSVFIAVLTGDDDDDARQVATDAGADVVLAKPVSPAELRSQVTRGVAQIRAAA